MKSFIVSSFVLIASSLIAGCAADTGDLTKEQPTDPCANGGDHCPLLDPCADGGPSCPIVLPVDPCANGSDSCPIIDRSCTVFVTGHVTCTQCGDAAATCQNLLGV